jgi:hypothetical protein
MVDRQPKRPPQAFIDLLKMLIDEEHYKSRAGLGRLMKMSGSRIGRAINGEYGFNIDNCLKLAERTNLSASLVLRASGREALADQIERLYGSDRPASDRMAAPKNWDILTAENRARVEGYIDRLIEKREEEERLSKRAKFSSRSNASDVKARRRQPSPSAP